MKKCPRCDHALTETDYGGIRVDGCHGCGGVWFDGHELTVATQQSAGLHHLEQQFAPGTSDQRRQQMSCPNCPVELVAFQFPHSPGITLDGCPQCKGIWVDDGELTAIADRLSKAQTEAARRPAPAAAPRPATTDARAKARQALSFLKNVQCTGCQQLNPEGSLMCWACGTILKGKRGFLCPAVQSSAVR